MLLSSIREDRRQMAVERNEQAWNSAQVRQEVALDDQPGTMAPLDLDKYAEIAKQCKYLPENDLKVKAPFLFFL